MSDKEKELPVGCRGCNSTFPCLETCGADPFHPETPMIIGTVIIKPAGNNENTPEAPDKIWLDSDCHIDLANIYGEQQFDTVEYVRADLAKPSEWISVATPPPAHSRVDCFLGEGGFWERKVNVYYDGERFHLAVGSQCVTHWKPIPSQPPKAPHDLPNL